jgi:hypothetical protein
MAQATESAIGATASCPDGVRGEVSRMTVDPAARTVTHLVIEPKHRREPGRLAPFHLVDTTAGDFECCRPLYQRNSRTGRPATTSAGTATPVKVSERNMSQATFRRQAI